MSTYKLITMVLYERVMSSGAQLHNWHAPTWLGEGFKTTPYVSTGLVPPIQCTYVFRMYKFVGALLALV
jgi:hypothetical protein